MLVRASLYSGTSIPAVAKSLDASALRAKAIANNLANVNTPDYRRIEVRFEDDLRRALSPEEMPGLRTEEEHLPLGRVDLSQVGAKAYRPKDAALPGEINNVDVDLEAAKLAENQILFQYGVRFIQDRKGAIEAAITLRSQA